MSMVKIKNVSSSKSPFYCGLSDNSSLSLQFGQSSTVDESLLTDYIKRRAKLGDLLITQLKSEVKSNTEQTKTNGGKKVTTNKKN